MGCDGYNHTLWLYMKDLIKATFRKGCVLGLDNFPVAGMRAHDMLNASYSHGLSGELNSP